MDNTALPESWAVCRVGEVTSIQLGKMLDKARESEGEPRAYLRNQNVRWGEFDLTDLYEMPYTDTEREKFSLQKNDLLVCEGGEPGRAAIWRAADTEIKFQKALHRVRVTCGLLPEWLLYRLRFDATNGLLNQYFTGSTIKHLTRTAFLNYKISLPPLNEQRRIVAKIEDLTARSQAAKQALDAIPPLLERFRQSVLAAAFRGDLTKQWRQQNPNVEPATELLKRIRQERRHRWEQDYLAQQKAKGKTPKDEKWKEKYQEPEPVDTTGLPELPEGWCWVYLPEVGEVSRGKSKHRPRNDPSLYSSNGMPFIQTGEVANSGGRITRATKFYSETGVAQSRVFPKGTVCITIAANIADSAILELDACFPDSVVGVICTDGLACSHYVEYFIRTARASLEMYAPATAQKNINLAILSQVAVPIPPVEEQKVIVQTLNGAFDSIRSLDSARDAVTSQLTRLSQSILAKAFRGELVPQDPNDEPASAILERIRAERQAKTPGENGKKRKGRGG